MLEIVGIAGRAVVGVLACEIVGELAHIERADQDAACRFHTRNQRRVRSRGRAISVDLGASARRQSGDVEQVLDSERRTRERPNFVPLMRAASIASALASACPHYVGEGAKRAIASSDAIERFLRDLTRARGAGPNRRSDCLGRSVEEHGRHGENTGAGSS